MSLGWGCLGEECYIRGHRDKDLCIFRKQQGGQYGCLGTEWAGEQEAGSGDAGPGPVGPSRHCKNVLDFTWREMRRLWKPFIRAVT